MGSISHLERSLSYAVESRLRRIADRKRLYAAASWTVRAALIALVVAFTPTSGRAGTFVAYGPQQYVRQTGTPTPVTTSFTVLDPTTTFTMRIDNSGVSSAIVTLNGVVVFSESDFNATVTLLTKAVTLQATNQLVVELRGQPGENFRLQIIGTDNAPPTITAAVTPAPNAAGWNHTDATVNFTCSDRTSGIATCPAPVAVTTETAGQSVSGTAIDKAGNTATASVTVKLDKTLPDLNVSSPANGSRVFVSHITVGGTVTDALSGPASVTCNGVPAVLSGATFSCGVTVSLGTNSIVVTAADIAGNTRSTTLGLTYAPVPTVRFTSPTNLSFINLSPTTV